MPIEKIHPDGWIALIIVLTICWTISLYLALVFVLVSTSIFKFLSIMLLLAEILVGAAAIWFLIMVTEEAE